MMRRLPPHARVTPLVLAPAPPPCPPEIAPPRAELAAVLRNLLARERELCPERIRGLVLRELSRFRGDREVTLALHPDDRAWLPDSAELCAQSELGSLALIDDSTLVPGGCRLHSARGEVDASIDAQLERLLAQVERALELPARSTS